MGRQPPDLPMPRAFFVLDAWWTRRGARWQTGDVCGILNGGEASCGRK